ncbi:MAG: response regulator [Bacteroidota bacterium]
MENTFYIVVADDDLDDQYLIKQAVLETGINHHITFLSNGLQLMDLLLKKGEYSETDQRQPDLIFLDLNMPLLDGYGALTQIRSNLIFKDLPIYVLSTSRFEYDNNRSKQLGANDFFTKPTRLPELKDLVKNICLRTVEALDKLKN